MTTIKKSYTIKNKPKFISTNTITTSNKITYHCSGPNDDYIEVPGGSESVVYTDDEGQSYEISISDLQEYDDDNEIQYTSSRKVPSAITQKQNIQLLMFKQKYSKIHC